MKTTLEKRSPRHATTGHYASAERHVKLQRLLVPVDFTPATLPALRFANTLAGQFGSTIRLLHVIEDHPMAMGESAVMVTKLEAELSEGGHGAIEPVGQRRAVPICIRRAAGAPGKCGAGNSAHR